MFNKLFRSLSGYKDTRAKHSYLYILMKNGHLCIKHYIILRKEDKGQAIITLTEEKGKFYQHGYMNTAFSQ